MKNTTSEMYSRKPNSYIGLKKDTPCFLSKKVKPAHFPLDFVYINNKSQYLIIKNLLSPLSPIINWKRTITKMFIDGFIEETIGIMIKRYIKPMDSILEIGVGSGKLIKYINTNSNRYCGLDIYDVSPVKIKNDVDIIVADAEDIPLRDNSVDVVISTETLEHIPHVKTAIEEIYRVCKNKSYLIVSIPNNYCHKYKVKGPHPEHVNNWHYRDLINELSPRFSLIEGQMKGYWLPYFKNSKYSFQIPISSSDEHFNTNFFYVFECNKKK